MNPKQQCALKTLPYCVHGYLPCLWTPSGPPRNPHRGGPWRTPRSPHSPGDLARRGRRWTSCPPSCCCSAWSCRSSRWAPAITGAAPSPRTYRWSETIAGWGSPLGWERERHTGWTRSYRHFLHHTTSTTQSHHHAAAAAAAAAGHTFCFYIFLGENQKAHGD